MVRPLGVPSGTEVRESGIRDTAAKGSGIGVTGAEGSGTKGATAMVWNQGSERGRAFIAGSQRVSPIGKHRTG